MLCSEEIVKKSWNNTNKKKKRKKRTKYKRIKDRKDTLHYNISHIGAYKRNN